MFTCINVGLDVLVGLAADGTDSVRGRLVAHRVVALVTFGIPAINCYVEAMKIALSNDASRLAKL